MTQSTNKTSSIRKAEDVSASHFVAPVQPLSPYHSAPMIETCPQQYVLTQKMVDGVLTAICEHRESYDFHIECPSDATLIEDSVSRSRRLRLNINALKASPGTVL